MTSKSPAWFRGGIDHEFLRDVAEISNTQQVRFIIPRSLHEEILNFSGVMGYKGSIMRTLIASFAIARRIYHLVRDGGKILCLFEKNGKKEVVELFFDFKPSTEV
ncbi:hypothetical protein IPJ70_03345 [Candidatus Campbellbacteria bacterium]|nr:MAG: hypothetical protein IPJ70_03345 [Candidatus Campbellbacteria bacterium]